jgi:hypothetical protein
MSSGRPLQRWKRSESSSQEKFQKRPLGRRVLATMMRRSLVREECTSGATLPVGSLSSSASVPGVVIVHCYEGCGECKKGVRSYA